VSADLQPPQDFLESHRAYLAQVRCLIIVVALHHHRRYRFAGDVSMAFAWYKHVMLVSFLNLEESAVCHFCRTAMSAASCHVVM
jgi:hypothetical protein